MAYSMPFAKAAPTNAPFFQRTALSVIRGQRPRLGTYQGLIVGTHVSWWRKERTKRIKVGKKQGDKPKCIPGSGGRRASFASPHPRAPFTPTFLLAPLHSAPKQNVPQMCRRHDLGTRGVLGDSRCSGETMRRPAAAEMDTSGPDGNQTMAVQGSGAMLAWFAA